MHNALHLRALTTKNRATVVNARATRRHTVLITGVALLALKICLRLYRAFAALASEHVLYVYTSRADSDAKVPRTDILGAALLASFTTSEELRNK
jgi:hypothetical protein